ncbi:MAG: peptidoglycan-binding protein [Chloroflexota bacterium]
MRLCQRYLVYALVGILLFSGLLVATPQRATAAPAWPIVSPGESNENVVTLQYTLRFRGYSLSVDGAFSPETENVVRQFQQAHGLAVDGVVGGQTWERLVHQVVLGDHNDVVLALQRQLNNKYGYSLLADGAFGIDTDGAVKDFQASRQLAADGVVGLNTWAALLGNSSGDDPGGPGDPGGISPASQAQMDAMYAHARAQSLGKVPDGYCYEHVSYFIDAVGYGYIAVNGFNAAIDPNYYRYARQFAEYLNQNGNAERLGMRRLNLDNPYHAPAGAIIVVRAGAPGTYHATAGDISIAGGNGEFYNGGMMDYKGEAGYYPGNDFVLGIYVPNI